MSRGTGFKQRVRTSYDHSSSHAPSCATQRDKVHIHGVNNALEIKRYLYIQDL